MAALLLSISAMPPARPSTEVGVSVRLPFTRADPHPATRDVVGLLAELYRRNRPGTSR